MGGTEEIQPEEIAGRGKRGEWASRSMDGNKHDVQSIKDRLDAYREADRRIENQTEALERLQVKLEGIGAQEITGMPRSPSPSNDRISDLLNQKIEIEEEIAEDVETHRKERKNIKAILRKLRSADESAVITYRYLIGMSWYDVTDALFGAKEDYLGKEESYQRRTYNIHGQALLHMSILLKNQKE